MLRAGDRTRTGDVQLGKLAFYQLNYARVPLKISAPITRLKGCCGHVIADRGSADARYDSRFTDASRSREMRISVAESICWAMLNARS